MMTVREVVNKIRDNFDDYFDDATDIRLEEMRNSSGDRYELTISFLVTDGTPIEALDSYERLTEVTNQYSYHKKLKFIRQYKRFIVDKNSGEIISIYNHNDE